VIAPEGLTQVASTAEAALFIGTVALMHSPQTINEPPPALITAWVMFWLPGLLGLLRACVP